MDKDHAAACMLALERGVILLLKVGLCRADLLQSRGCPALQGPRLCVCSALADELHQDLVVRRLERPAKHLHSQSSMKPECNLQSQCV